MHSVSSLVCLKKLIEKGCKPEVVIIHKKYERENLQETFFLPVIKLCKVKKIPLIQTDTPAEIKEEIRNCEIGFCVGYMKILRKDFFELPKYGIFNLHCGKLPEYRGRAPISRTIMNGDKELIITLHKIDIGVDSGPIAVSTKIKITKKDDVNILYKKFSENSYKSITELLRNLRSGKLNLKKQKSTSKKAYTLLSENDRKINWGKGAVEIFNKIRALKLPYPQAFSTLKDKRYFFNNSLINNSASSRIPGKIEKISHKNILISSKDNLVKVSEIYSEGKKINPAKEFLIGDKFI